MNAYEKIDAVALPDGDPRIAKTVELTRRIIAVTTGEEPVFTFNAVIYFMAAFIRSVDMAVETTKEPLTDLDKAALFYKGLKTKILNDSIDENKETKQ